MARSNQPSMMPKLFAGLVMASAGCAKKSTSWTTIETCSKSSNASAHARTSARLRSTKSSFSGSMEAIISRDRARGRPRGSSSRAETLAELGDELAARRLGELEHLLTDLRAVHPALSVLGDVGAALLDAAPLHEVASALA